MFRVLSGITPTPTVPWLNGKVSEFFIRKSRSEWYEDPIIKEELRVVEHIVEPTFPMFKKESGVLIPPHWLSQGTRQFLYMTKVNKGIFDSFYFGVNVYPFFCKWAIEKDVDVTIKTNDLGVWEYKGLQGIFLNTGEYFSTGDELYKLITKNKDVLLKEYDKSLNTITAQKYRISSDGFADCYGDDFKIKL